MEDLKKEQSSPYAVPLAIIVAGVLIGGAVLISSGDRQASPAANNDINGVPEEINISLEGWPSIGDSNAPVVMVEYSDYACPFCQRFWQDTLPSIKRDYIDTGIVRFIYKDFAVVGGDRVAEAAHCAGEQGSYWEYHDMLFERHAQDRSQWTNPQVHRGYAEELGLNADELVACFEERRYQGKVAQSTQEAMANGGRGTPYFLINGEPVSGAQPYPVFQSAIDLALSEI
jgi:protein-disulfide isomerase